MLLADNAPAEAPWITELREEINNENDELWLTVAFSTNYRYRIVLDYGLTRDLRRLCAGGARGAIQPLIYEEWGRAQLDYDVEMATKAIREELYEARRAGASPDWIMEIDGRLLDAMRRAREHHAGQQVQRWEPAVMGVDMARGDDRMVMVYGGARGGRGRRQLAYERMLQVDDAAVRRYVDGAWNTDYAKTDADRKAAEKRGMDLLLAELSPAQRQMYERTKSFYVKGGATGTLYLIKHGTHLNVFECDKKGKPVQGRCFLPAGGLVTGDVLLAQKTALELFETEALKVAHPFRVGHTDFVAHGARIDFIAYDEAAQIAPEAWAFAARADVGLAVQRGPDRAPTATEVARRNADWVREAAPAVRDHLNRIVQDALQRIGQIATPAETPDGDNADGRAADPPAT